MDDDYIALLRIANWSLVLESANTTTRDPEASNVNKDSEQWNQKKVVRSFFLL